MSHGDGSTMDVDGVQDEQLHKAIAESLAMSIVDEVEETLPPDAWVRKDNRSVVLGSAQRPSSNSP
jgi:hypothetical protein